MRHLLITAVAFLLVTVTNGQPLNYKKAESVSGSNFYTVVKEWRAYFDVVKKQFKIANPGKQSMPEELREEIAQFERWVYNWRDKVDGNGSFPSASQGWQNLMQTDNKRFNNAATQARAQSSVWTSLGPVDSAISNGWTYGAGIGRVNVVRKVAGRPVLLAGTASGGIFRSANMGDEWTPVGDNIAGLGISDIVFHPTNPAIMFAATGDYDAGHMTSIGIFKSTDTGKTWNVTGLTFTLNQTERIAHIVIDPANPDIMYATAKFGIYRTEDGGLTWNQYFTSGSSDYFNDIIKVGNFWFATDKNGRIWKSNPAFTDNTNSFLSVFNTNRATAQAYDRLDFAWTPANPDTLYVISQVNPAFFKFSVVNNGVTAYTNITNSVPADGSGVYKTQGGYNQVIAVSPTDPNMVWVGEFSGKVSLDGGATWTNKLNGYYDPNVVSKSWGGVYVHSDHHDITFVGSDTLLIGNDGGVYIGKISTNEYKQKFNGLKITQSYSMAINDAEPQNLMIGNQDNDGMSRVFENNESKFYGAQAGDGTATAISHADNLTRYIGGTNGSLSYRTDAYKTNWSGTAIAEPNEAPFVWDMQMHGTNGTVLYGGFTGIYRLSNAPTGAWTALNTAIGKVRSITLANRDANTQKIIAIGEDNSIVKSEDETTWSNITPPVGVVFNSIYAKKTDWNILYATASGYNAANKIFYSTDNGASWTNITKNMENIQMKKIMLYEGSDTLFIATELGVYFGRVSDATTARTAGANPWAVYGTGLPRVRIEDMEISYAKKQLFISTFGRGVYLANLSNVTLPAKVFNFTYVKKAGGYQLKWNIEGEEVVKSTIEKSFDGFAFKALESFTGGTRLFQPGYNVANDKATVYYRLYYTKASGQKVYSQVIVIRTEGNGLMVNIYPNPTNGAINVSSSETIEDVRIYSLGGQQLTLARPNANFYSFDLSLLPKGTYLLQISDTKGNTYQQQVVRN